MCRNMKQKLNYHPCQRHGRIHMLHTYFSNFQYVGMYNKKATFVRHLICWLLLLHVPLSLHSFYSSESFRCNVLFYYQLPRFLVSLANKFLQICVLFSYSFPSTFYFSLTSFLILSSLSRQICYYYVRVFLYLFV